MNSFALSPGTQILGVPLVFAKSWSRVSLCCANIQYIATTF